MLGLVLFIIFTMVPLAYVVTMIFLVNSLVEVIDQLKENIKRFKKSKHGKSRR